jgi:hypothetical protein
LAVAERQSGTLHELRTPSRPEMARVVEQFAANGPAVQVDGSLLE